jgi:hypothetical protein
VGDLPTASSAGAAFGGNPVGRAVDRALGPAHWHDRLPFYARMVGLDAVACAAGAATGVSEALDQRVVEERRELARGPRFADAGEAPVLQMITAPPRRP